MSERKDTGERDIDRLRSNFRRLPPELPSERTDAAIRSAARRGVPRRNVWPFAAGLAACVALGVMLGTTLLIELEHRDRPALGEVRLLSERDAASAAEVRRAQRESAARRQEAPPPVAARDYAEAKSRPPETLAAPPAETAAAAETPSPVRDPGGRHAEQLAALRAELAGANEQAWRDRLLALRAADDEALAERLLADFRERFGRPPAYTLDDLAAEQPAAREPLR